MTSAVDLGEAMGELVRSGALDLPAPTKGRTAQRLHALARIAQDDLQVARLAESHTDALAILEEAGATPKPGAMYGVWAAEDPGAKLTAIPSADMIVLDGSKVFCTGGGLVDRALVTARTAAGEVVLIDAPLETGNVSFDHSSWLAPAFQATGTATATFSQLQLPLSDVIGSAGWYLDRLGFWHGACGPAACWAGGAIGLINYTQSALALREPEPHRDAHLGALVCLRWELNAMLQQAGDEIDAKPDDQQAAIMRAISLRHRVERSVTSTIEHVGQILGPRSLAFDAFVIRRIEELQLYVRQHHDQRDLATIAQSR
jgi:hypothetical protein